MPKKTFKDLSGHTFGRWVVSAKEDFPPYIRRRSNGKIVRYWHFVCQCGTARYVDSPSLVHGRSLSCGCLHKDILQTRSKPDSGFRRLLSHYKSSAVKRGLGVKSVSPHFQKGLKMDFTKSRKNTQSNKSRIEDGTFMARIVQVVDLGVQKGEYKGEETIRPEVMITFEFPTETITVEGEEKPRWLSKQYTVSMNEKSALYALVNAADPDGKVTKKGSDAKRLLSLPVMVTVGSTATGNAKVVGVSRMMKGMSVPELYNDPVFFELDSNDTVNKQAFEGLPDWLQEKIKTSMNYSTSKFAQGGSEEQQDADNPF